MGTNGVVSQVLRSSGAVSLVGVLRGVHAAGSHTLHDERELYYGSPLTRGRYGEESGCCERKGNNSSSPRRISRATCICNLHGRRKSNRGRFVEVLIHIHIKGIPPDGYPMRVSYQIDDVTPRVLLFFVVFTA